MITLLSIRHLQKDPVMKTLIRTHGPIPNLSPSENLFADLVEAIVNQQLSEKAGATIFKRFKGLFGDRRFPKPQHILDIPDQNIRDAGLSWSKITYIKGISEAILNKKLLTKNLYQLSDELVIEELVKLKGVGRWTAEMILIFSLNRPDIFSMGDLGLRTAVSRLYRIDRENFKKIEAISLRWKPFRSYASRYLWKSLDNV